MPRQRKRLPALPGDKLKLEQVGQMSLEFRQKMLGRLRVVPERVEDCVYLAVRGSSLTPNWRGLLSMMGFRWSSWFRSWIYDQHDDGTLVAEAEAKWVADRLQVDSAGALTAEMRRGRCVQPKDIEDPRTGFQRASAPRRDLRDP